MQHLIVVSLTFRCEAGMRSPRPERRVSVSGANGPATEQVELVDVRQDGRAEPCTLTRQQFLTSTLADCRLPPRDLRLLLRGETGGRARLPSLLSRPSARCFILDIEHIKVGSHCTEKTTTAILAILHLLVTHQSVLASDYAVR